MNKEMQVLEQCCGVKGIQHHVEPLLDNNQLRGGDGARF